MELPRINLHAHTTYSDGKNSIKDMVYKALELNINYLAITDHLTNSWKSGLMNPLDSRGKIEEYLEEISEYQEFLIGNNKNLRLYKGIEVDLSSSRDYIQRLIYSPTNFEIILFEYLETPEGIAFIKNLIDQWKLIPSKNKTFPILGLAHFDPSNFIFRGLDRLIQFLKKYNIYVELNSSYSDFYSIKNKIFFEMVQEYQIPVGIGSDAHLSNNLSLIQEPLDRIKDFGLENNLFLLIELLKKERTI